MKAKDAIFYYLMGAICAGSFMYGIYSLEDEKLKSECEMRFVKPGVDL